MAEGVEDHFLPCSQQWVLRHPLCTRPPWLQCCGWARATCERIIETVKDTPRRKERQLTARMATSKTLSPEEREQRMVGNVAEKVMWVGRNKVFLVGLALILALFLTACSVSASTANISDAKMTQDEAGNNPTKVFSPNDQTFYCIAELSNAPENTAVKAVWTAVHVEGVKANLKIDESRITADESGQLTFDLTNDGPWPVGEYEVELFLNDGEDPERTLEFKVQ
jgi:hypothetical protein